MTLGATMQLPERDTYHMQKKQVLCQIMVLFAGRIAEEIFCQDISAGAQNDIERSTDLATKMVCEWGMSRAVGPVRLARGEREDKLLPGEIPLPGNKPFSEDTARLVDREIRRILETCYQQTTRLVQKHREDLDRVARELLRHEVLELREVEMVLAGQPLPDPPGGSEPKAAIVEDKPAPIPERRELSAVPELLELLERGGGEVSHA